jgi:DNA-binding LacI/PurR family transcriptional regulator
MYGPVRKPSKNRERPSLHEQVASELLAMLRKGLSTGDRLPSEAALSEMLGVSTITLREALSVLAHRGFIERRHGSGTYVADPAKGQWIAIVTNTDLSDPRVSYFHRRIAMMVRKLIAETGLRARLYSGVSTGRNTGENGNSVPNFLLEDIKIDAIRAIVSLDSDAHALFRDIPLPLVGAGRKYSYSVSVESNAVLRRAVAVLKAEGRKNIAVIGWGSEADRKACMDYLKSQGLSSRREWIRNNLNPASSAAGWLQFEDIWTASKQKPDGLIVLDDVLFHDVALAVLKHKVDVPRSLSVVTHYNLGSGIITPFECVCIAIDPDIIARSYADMLQLVLQPNPPPEKHVETMYEVIPGIIPIPAAEIARAIRPDDGEA